VLGGCWLSGGDVLAELVSLRFLLLAEQFVTGTGQPWVASTGFLAMLDSILAPGEKIHVIHRRRFDQEPHRHFVGVVDDYREGVLRMTGHVYAVDTTTYQFIRRPEQRTRVVSVVSGEVIVNVIPASVDLSKITYRQEGSAVRVSDGSDWHLDISEVGWR
jgi:hypothetical protein